ncbi:MAG TPA: stage III sporulation protein AD [Clostridia bacterium]|nr:stage III sporulation protein AD [Clostridia bacterium]
MNFVQIIIIAVIAVAATLVIRQINPEISMLVGIGSGVLVLILVLDELYEVVYAFYNIAEISGVNKSLFSTILKIIGIGYLAEFGNGICVDANAKSLGDKLLLAGKVVILVTALPIIMQLIQTIMELAP